LHLKQAGIRVECEPGVVLKGPNLGTDILDDLRSNTTIGGSADSGCTFRGGGIQAYGRGSDSGQSLKDAISHLVISNNKFEDMTYAQNNFRSNGGIFIGGGSNDIVISRNTFSNITPYDDGFNADGKTYIDQYEPDGGAARAAIWFYGAYRIVIDHNSFLHVYQNIKGCQAQLEQAELITISHNYSDSHHRMFLEINGGGGCGHKEFNAGVKTFEVFRNFDFHAGGRHPGAGTFGFSAPLQSQPNDRIAWYDNLLVGVSNDAQYTGMGMEIGAENMQVYNNTLLSQWPCAACAFGGSNGGFIRNNYACMLTPTRYPRAAFAEEHGHNSTSVVFENNNTPDACPKDLRTVSVTLGPVSNASGLVTATALVTTIEPDMQGVVFSIDGTYASVVLGPGPYKLSYGTAALGTGAHRITATAIDAVGQLTVSGERNISTTHGVGPSGPLSPNIDPRNTNFEAAGNTDDPINHRR
jgi:hypothetical protein